MSYQHLAQVYDYLMQDAPYDKWLRYIERICQHYQHTPKRVLDLACGTGAIAIPLAQQGLEVCGLDLSPEMLAMADAKARERNVKLRWIEQDMTLLELAQQVDTILCFCDSLNYIVEEKLLKQMFQRVYNQLSKGGLFLFDCHSLYQLEHIYGNNTFTHNEEEIAYIWQSYYNHREYTVTHELSFFIQEEGQTYIRFDEWHQQRAYPLDKLVEWLQACGFELLEISADFRAEPPKEESKRWFVAARK